MIFGIRHLPTKYNDINLLQGTINTDSIIIRENDIISIKKNLKKINDISKYEILCSELKRTQITAEIYNLKNYKICDYLNELNFLQYEGNQSQN